MTMQGINQRLEARDIVVAHLLLIVVQTAGDAILLSQQRTREPTVINLRERLTFYLMLQTRVLGMILTADPSPEYSILRLGVEHHAVEIKKSSFKLTMSHYQL